MQAFSVGVFRDERGTSASGTADRAQSGNNSASSGAVSNGAFLGELVRVVFHGECGSSASRTGGSHSGEELFLGASGAGSRAVSSRGTTQAEVVLAGEATPGLSIGSQAAPRATATLASGGSVC